MKDLDRIYKQIDFIIYLSAAIFAILFYGGAIYIWSPFETYRIICIYAFTLYYPIPNTLDPRTLIAYCLRMLGVLMGASAIFWFGYAVLKTIISKL